MDISNYNFLSACSCEAWNNDPSVPRGDSNWSPQGMFAKFRATVFLQIQMLFDQLMPKLVTFASPEYVHDCLAISVLKPLQITVGFLPHISQGFEVKVNLCSMLTRLSNYCKESAVCNLYIFNTMPPTRSMCFSLWAKFIQIHIEFMSNWRIPSQPFWHFWKNVRLNRLFQGSCGSCVESTDKLTSRIIWVSGCPPLTQ